MNITKIDIIIIIAYFIFLVLLGFFRKTKATISQRLHNTWKKIKLNRFCNFASKYMVRCYFRSRRKYILIRNSDLVYFRVTLLFLCSNICFLAFKKNLEQKYIIYSRCISKQLWRKHWNYQRCFYFFII